MNVEETLLQALMTQAYDTWNQMPHLSYADWLKKLNRDQRDAVLIGNFNYQVENGGVQQYVDNGYALHMMELIERLNTIGADNQTITELANKLVQLSEYVDFTKKDRGFHDYWVRTQYDREYDTKYQYAIDLAEQLTEWYYKSAKNVLLEVAEKHFSNKLEQTPENTKPTAKAINRTDVIKLVQAWNEKYRTIKADDTIFLTGSSVEIVDDLRDQLKRRRKGRYEVVCVVLPQCEDIMEIPDNVDDDEIDDLHNQFNAVLREVTSECNGIGNWVWVIPMSDEKYNVESLAMHFMGPE